MKSVSHSSGWGSSEVVAAVVGLGSLELALVITSEEGSSSSVLDEGISSSVVEEESSSEVEEESSSEVDEENSSVVEEESSSTDDDESLEESLDESVSFVSCFLKSGKYF